MTGMAFMLLGEPAVPLPSDTIAVTLATEPSVPANSPPPENPSPSQEPAQPEAVALPPENPPPAASEPPETPAPPLPEPEPSVAAPPEPVPVPQTPPNPRATSRPRAEPRPPPALAPRKREPVVAPSAAPVGPTAAGQPQPSPAPVANQQAFAPLVPPRPVSGLASNRKPDYPIEARSRRQQGRVLLRVQVSATGDAASVDIVSSSGHPILDQAARAALRTWRFVPAIRAGTAVAASADVPIEFRMDE
jgi:protein TonB